GDLHAAHVAGAEVAVGRQRARGDQKGRQEDAAAGDQVGAGLKKLSHAASFSLVSVMVIVPAGVPLGRWSTGALGWGISPLLRPAPRRDQQRYAQVSCSMLWIAGKADQLLEG